MTPHEAERVLSALPEDELIPAIGVLAAATPNVFYWSSTLTDGLGSLENVQVYSAVISAQKLLKEHPGGAEGTSHVILGSGEVVRINFAMPATAFDDPRSGIPALSGKSDALQTLLQVPDHTLRHIVSRLVNRVDALCVAGPATERVSDVKPFEALAKATTMHTDPKAIFRYAIKFVDAATPTHLGLFQALVYREGSPLPEDVSRQFRFDLEWERCDMTTDFVPAGQAETRRFFARPTLH